MNRQAVTREQVAAALRQVRVSRGLTQRAVAQRAEQFKELGLGGLLESQISDFERGRAMPSFGSLVNFLAACSNDGEEVNFRTLQHALDVCCQTRTPKQASSEDARRLIEQQKDEIAGLRHEVAQLRIRISRTEQLLVALSDNDHASIRTLVQSLVVT